MRQKTWFEHEALMTPAEEYRNLAANLHARASKEASPLTKVEWDYLAHCYELLAEQAEKSRRTDRTYEPILRN